MKTEVIVPICFFLYSFSLLAQEERPILKEPPAQLVQCMESTARANLAAARLNVVRDVAQKKLRIYSTTVRAKAGHSQAGKFDVEVIYNNDLAVEHKSAAAPYHHQHNSVMLTFAVAEFASGTQTLGVHLAKLLAEAEPDLFWSSPSHSPVSIQAIVLGLEKDASGIKDILIEQKDYWIEIVRSAK